MNLDFHSAPIGGARRAGGEATESFSTIHARSAASSHLLMEEVCERENLKQAWQQVKANKHRRRLIGVLFQLSMQPIQLLGQLPFEGLQILRIAQPTKDEGKESKVEHTMVYRTIQVDWALDFYQGARPKDAPTLLPLHGLPSSSRMFERWLAGLSDCYPLVAPDGPFCRVINESLGVPKLKSRRLRSKSSGRGLERNRPALQINPRPSNRTSSV